MATGELLAVISAPNAGVKIGLYKMQPSVFAMRVAPFGWPQQHWSDQETAMKRLLAMQSYGPNERVMLERICKPEFILSKSSKKRK